MDDGWSWALGQSEHENILGREVAGAMARFWVGGTGPSHASISTAFALAGYDEPLDAQTSNKEDRVRRAVRLADDDTGRRLIEELLDILRAASVFDEGRGDQAAVQGLRRALARTGVHLSADGFVDWWRDPDLLEVDERSSANKARTASAEVTSTGASRGSALPDAPVVEVVTPSLALLVSSLRRIPSALRPLMVRRRRRDGLVVNDEYDMQDAVEALLRSLYNDVRPEERTPSSAGASSQIDFLIREESTAVEVKVTAPGRAERQIKPEILIDINDYRAHPHVRNLVVVIYDLHSTFANSHGFEADLSGKVGQLDVHVLVVGWPVAPSR